MKKTLFNFIKSLKDPCKLCLVLPSCVRGVDCPKYLNHVKAKRDLKNFIEKAAAITLLIFAFFGFIFIGVLIGLGSIKFYELLF